MYEDVEFQVISTLHVPSVVLQLFSKGLLKISKIIPLENGKANFTIFPKFSYTPRAHVIVFYVDGDGAIVSDSMTLYFENILPNFVSFINESLN